MALAIGAGFLAAGCTCGGPGGSSSRNVGPPVRLTVGPSGGSLTSADGVLTITVPAGALSAPVDLTIQQIVNSAPVGQGNAYELGPAGQAFAAPILLAFRNTTALPNGQLWLSYLINQTGQNQGLWIRAASVAVDGTANTLSTAVSDFGWADWSLVGTGPNVGKDLAGTFALVSTLEVPFAATTTQLMLVYAGEDARATYYFPVGPLTIQSPVTLGSASCSPISPPGASVQVASNAVVELRKGADPIPLLLAIDAHWDLSCSNGATALADTRFDTLGISLGTCTRSYAGTPTLTAAGIRCDAGNGCFYLIDCGARGQERATFNFTPCTPGVACASSNACHTAAISCTTGFPVCTDNGDVADGTSCGTNQVCGGGVCNACAAGQPCASGNPCHTAALVCSSGYPVCTDNGNQPNGTSCGTNQVCTAGACTACTQGAACTPTNPCHNGVQDCAQGYACVDAGTSLADGTSCGTNQVCGGGVCNACIPGQPCPSGNPCHTAALVCSSGFPVCTDNGNQANGTGCGAGQTCNAGACVPSRTVAGARLVTQWPDSGPDVPVPAPDVAAVPPAAPVAVSALVPDGAGGWINYPGSFPSPGSFSIAAVPVGSYLLDYVDGGGAHILVDTSASSIDLGYDAPGRSGAVKASGPTPVTFSLSGLNPWNAGGDRIEITSSNADAWDFLPSSGLAPGATSGDLVEDWFAAQADGAPLELLAPADLLYLHQLASATDASSLNAYQYASHWTSLTGATLSDQLAASLSPPPFQAIAPLAGSLPATTWNLSQFDQLASMNPTATTDASAHSLVVGASPFPLAAPGPAARAAPLLLAMRLPRGTTPDPSVGTLSYGQFLDALWHEWRGASFTVHVSYLAPSATVALDQTATLGLREAMPPPAGPIAPEITPVQSPLVNGASAFATMTGVGPTPAISWTAPATGPPTRYALEVYWLHAIAGSSVATRVATWVTSALAVSLPPGVLQPGSTYFARITAYAIPGDPYAAATPAPLRQPALYGHASVLTGTFSP